MKCYPVAYADMKMIERDDKSLHTLRHTNIVKFFAVVVDKPGEVGLLLEFVKEGSLRRLLDDEIPQRVIGASNVQLDLICGIGYVVGCQIYMRSQSSTMI